MKILQICKKFPYPLKDGESLAVNYLSKSLAELGCEITLLTMNTSKHYFHFTHLPEELSHYKAIHYVDLNNDVNWKGALINLFSKESYHVSRYNSNHFSQKLTELLQAETYDFIHLETLYVTQYIPLIRRLSDAVVVLRSHNVEFEIWQRVADNTRFFLKRWYVNYLTRKLRNFEVKQIQKIDLLLAITDRDLKTFRSLGYLQSAKIIPIGLDTSDYLALDKSVTSNPSLSFIGSLDWIPNVEGLEWFLKDIWPLLHAKYPALTFHVAGRNMSPEMQHLQIPNVTFYGEVEDAKKFINAFPIMVVPLLSGSGMRVKILEGMFLGRIVVTTSLGLEGINAKDRNQVLVAETVQEFVRKIDFCFDHPLLTQHISHRAQVFAARHYDNLEIGKELYSYYKLKKSKQETVRNY